MHESGSFLQRILDSAKADVALRSARLPERELVRRIADAPPARQFEAEIRRAGFAVVAEFKRVSPSKGPIFPEASPERMARAYERAGATALSILTNAPFFGGSDADLVDAKAATRLPVLRKDFVVSTYQIHEARMIGADAILLIAAALDDRELGEFVKLAKEIGLSALVETHTAEEIRRATLAGAGLIGINNRDLHTFETTLQTSLSLRCHIPAGVTVISESGVSSADDTDLLRRGGFHGVLVGETLMRSAQVSEERLTVQMKELLGRAD